MKTNKKGISLIVLIITVIVLGILAATVIMSISNTNIIEETNKTVFKSDMSNYKELYTMYIADYMMQNDGQAPVIGNVVYGDALFTTIFGDNVKEEYTSGLKIQDGRLVYETENTEQLSVLSELNMVAVAVLKIGDLVSYVPSTNPDQTYSGATYVVGEYGWYDETTIDTYKPGNMKWVYLGQDENGNILLTSQETTSFEMTIGGGGANIEQNMDNLCNTLYGNSAYGQARNMKIADVDRILEYDGPLGFYLDLHNNPVITQEPLHGGDEPYTYIGSEYKDEETNEYMVIFKKADGVTNLSPYWLSSKTSAHSDLDGSWFFYRNISSGYVTRTLLYSASSYYSESLPLRPVIVLNSNIQIGEKINGEWTLVEVE